VGPSDCASCARSSTSSKATDTSARERAAASAGGSQAGERSLGILGGTFNPPHLGHLAVARHARSELGLERVLLVPTHTTPHKADVEDARDPGPAHRLRMCRLAVEGIEGVSACAVEIDRGGLSYTVDTLTSLHASHPHAQLTFIVGADTASTLGSWREPQQLLELARLAIAARAGAARERVLHALAGLHLADGAGGERRTAADGVRFLQMPAIEVSSSLVRHRVADGDAVEELVGPAVARYIAEHGLYRARAEALR
jgi:nicotinate-nucleotide adenylyltransferase